ncbi:MAG: hypothetical protein KIT14_03370 [bacterium]|nr:hypothetical protein [bacterium]
MPVHRFRTFEEARDALWLPSGDPRILARLRRLAQLARPAPIRRGVTRFRTIADAKAGRFVADPD